MSANMNDQAKKAAEEILKRLQESDCLSRTTTRDLDDIAEIIARYCPEPSDVGEMLKELGPEYLLQINTPGEFEVWHLRPNNAGCDRVATGKTEIEALRKAVRDV